MIQNGGRSMIFFIERLALADAQAEVEKEGMASSFFSAIWSESFWLPQGKTWNDLKSTETLKKPQAEDLYIVPPLAIILLVIRFLFER